MINKEMKNIDMNRAILGIQNNKIYKCGRKIEKKR